MIEITETRDLGFLKNCLTDAWIWRNSTDDAFAGVRPTLYYPSITEGYIYLRAGEYGLIIGIPVNLVTYDVHIVLLAKATGKARDICRAAISYVFSSYVNCQRLTASIPQDKPLVIRLAKDLGMELVGVDKKSFQRGGILLDRHMYGISKENYKCHH